jgi:hypothetical protein
MISSDAAPDSAQLVVEVAGAYASGASDWSAMVAAE